MLLVTRKCGEGIQIGDDILIVAAKNSRDKLKFGIIAPLDKKIKWIDEKDMEETTKRIETMNDEIMLMKEGIDMTQLREEVREAYNKYDKSGAN